MIKRESVGGAKGSPTSSESQSDALLFLVDLHRFIPVAPVILHHGPALVHKLLLTKKSTSHILMHS